MRIAIVVPNWNGKDVLPDCLDSLLNQTQNAEIVVVENGSVDGSTEMIKQKYPQITLLEQPKNLGFDGGVNVGIKYALNAGHEFIALFNNDAIAEKDWLKNLAKALENDISLGISTGKLYDGTKKKLDTTGDIYTTWGLAYPRGRGEPDTGQYDRPEYVFGATGGASLFRAKMFEEIGIFDNDFFAYYEDIDISFRAQLAGWKIIYIPSAHAYHQIGGTSGKIKGFTTYQTIKNLPWVFWKNVPRGLILTILPRFTIAYTSFLFASLSRGQFVPLFKGLFITTLLMPKKLFERHNIQKNKTVTDDYVRSILTWDLPPNAARLRGLREKLRKLTGKS